jgi:hypothetical protein
MIYLIIYQIESLVKLKNKIVHLIKMANES